MRVSSLSRQLIAGVLLAELTCATLFSVLAVGHEMHGRRRAFDVMLQGRADSLLGSVQDAEDPEDNVIVDPTELAVPREDAYEVLSPTGRSLGHSPDSSPAVMHALESSPRSGYFNFRVGRERYRALRYDGIRVIDRAETGGLRRPITMLYAAPTRDIWHETLEAVRFYVLVGVLLLAGTGFVLVWFLRRKLSPLNELAVMAGKVSAQSWQFVPPDAVLRTSELAPIAHSMAHLLDGLRHAFERQRQLTGDAAHEWKTSIAVLKSSVQLLSMNRRTSSQYEAGLEGLLLDTERMEELASRMLTLARLEEAPADSTASCDLKAVATAVVDRLQPIAARKHVVLDLRADETCPVEMHAEDADVLCSNLIMNALQHSTQGGQVRVTVLQEAETVVLTVVDAGDGIPEASLPYVFERFYRADRSRSRNSGGAGLGLSICKAIVERSHGAIEIHSADGRGTKVVARWDMQTSAAAIKSTLRPIGRRTPVEM